MHEIDSDDELDEIETMRNYVEEEMLMLLTVPSRKHLCEHLSHDGTKSMVKYLRN